MFAAHLLIVLLTSDDDIHIDLTKISLPLAAAAVVAIGVWLLLLGLFALFTRPKRIEAAPPTMELGEESPALVDFLVNHCRVTATAVPATLLDLAARHYIEIDEADAAQSIIRLRQPATPDLAPYELRVLQQIAILAENGVVPVPALTLGTTGRAANWRKAFDKEVTQDAKARGLAEDRWTFQEWTIERAVGLVAGALVIAVAAQAGAWEPALLAVGFVAASAHSTLAKLFGTYSLSEAGYISGGHWLGVRAYLAQGDAFESLPAGAVILWDRYMAYASALGLARTALGQLPVAAEDDHRAWSAYGGAWREVQVRYPRTRVVWGRTPLGGILVALIIGAVGGGIVWLMLQLYGFTHGYTDDTAHWIRVGSAIVAGVGVVVIAWGLRTAMLALADAAVPKLEVDGEVVRCRTYTRNEKQDYYFVGVDDGKLGKIKAWLVEPDFYNRVREGDIIHATVSRNFCHVYKMDIVRESRQGARVPPKDEAAASEGATPEIATAMVGFDATSLVSAEEAAAALGEEVKPAQPFTEPGALAAHVTGCIYQAASGSDASVVVVASQGAMVKMLSRLYDRPGTDSIDIAGGRAFVKQDAIILVRDDQVIMIRVHGGKGDSTAALKNLATQAAQRSAGTPSVSSS